MTSIATAFGLDVACETPLRFLHGASAKATGRTLALSTHPDDAARELWPADAELICDERLADGSVSISIERDAQAGYLIAGPAYGAHLLSADGTRLRCFPEGRPVEAWQRLLIAQVLPFAALLRGLEVFHASAVLRGRQAIAILGPSGAGKTSLALELCRLGSDFIADDVVALERSGEGLLAHPGSPLASINRAAANEDRLASVEFEGVVAADEREQLVEMRGATEPAALGALFFLDRRPDGPETPQFQPSADAINLLAATFDFVLATPERLVTLLDVCARAARLQVELIRSGPASTAAQLAGAIEQRLS